MSAVVSVGGNANAGGFGSALALVPPPTPDRGKDKPSGLEVTELAKTLGLDPVYDNDLLYIAEEFLLTPLPDGWTEYTHDDGRKYYFNENTRTTQWDHPLEDYFKGVIFMRKIGFNLLERKAQENPPSPAETREMATYFGIDVRKEFELLAIAKAAVNAPLPPEWDTFDDEEGETCFILKKSGRKLRHHPLDSYFMEIITQKRMHMKPSDDNADSSMYTLKDFDRVNENSVLEPWMEFYDRDLGKKYYFNFLTNERTFISPSHVIMTQIQHIAATKIQAIIKGWIARKFRHDENLHNAALVIQQAWKKSKSGKKKKASRKNPATNANKAKQEKYAKDLPQIIKIQRAYREYRALKMMVAQTEEDAALLIQSFWRGSVSRKTVSMKSMDTAVQLPEIGDIFNVENEHQRHVDQSVEKIVSFSMPGEPSLLHSEILRPESSNSTIASLTMKKSNSRKSIKRRKKRRSTIVSRK